MERSRRACITISLAAAAALLFFIGSAAAAPYDIIIDLDTEGSGTGNVISSATSSPDWEFFGWSGESCTGTGLCALRDLKPKNPKRIIASFNLPQCRNFIYSEFGACQLDGMMYRTVLSAAPPGCAGGDPIISQSCFFDPCAKAQTVELKAGLIDRFLSLINGIVSGVGKVIDKTADGILGVVDGVVNAINHPIETLRNIRDGVVDVVTTNPIKTIGKVIEDFKKDPLGKVINIGISTIIPGYYKAIPTVGKYSPKVVTTPVVNAKGEITYVDIPVLESLEPIPGEIDLSGKFELEPLVVKAPRYKPEPKFDFNFDFNFGKVLRTGGGGGCGEGFFHYY